jgi:WD40 repeat protein
VAYSGPKPSTHVSLQPQPVAPRPLVYESISVENLPRLALFLEFKPPSVSELHISYERDTLRWPPGANRLVFDSELGPQVYDVASLERIPLEATEAQGYISAISAYTFTRRAAGFQIVDAGGGLVTEGEVRNPPISDVVFSGDARRVAVIDKNQHVYLYDLTTGSLVSSFVQVRVTSAALNYDGTMFAGITSGGTVQFFDPERGTLLGGLTPPFGSRVNLPVAMSADKTHAAFRVGQDVVLYDLLRGTTVRIFEKGLAPRGLVFSPDGHFLAGFQGLSLWVWDVATGLVKVTQGTGSINCLMASPDGQRLLVGDVSPTARLYSWSQAGETMTAHLEGVMRTAGACPIFSANGLWLVYASPEEKGHYTVHVVRLSNLQERLQFPILSEVRPEVALSPDGAYVALANGQRTIGVFSAEDGHRVAQLVFPTEAYSVAFGEDGSLVAAGRNFIAKWSSIDDGQAESLQISNLGPNKTPGMAYHSPNGEWWVTPVGSSSGRVWHMANLQELATTPFALPSKRHFNFDPGGDLLVSVTSGNIEFWDPTTAARLALLPLDRAGNRVALSATGHWLAVGTFSNDVQLFAVEAEGPRR